MSDDVSSALREIADLLRKRNDSQSALSERAERRLEQMRIPRQIPDYTAMRQQHERDMEDSRELSRQHRAEDIEFRERLLASIERQNALLAQLVERGR